MKNTKLETSDTKQSQPEALRPPSTRNHEDPDHERRKVGQHSPEPSHPEIAEVPHERRPKLLRRSRRARLHRRLPLVLSRHERPHLLRRHPDPTRLERRLRRLVGELRVERLPLPALVVDLSGQDPKFRPKSRSVATDKPQPTLHRFPKPSPRPRKQRLQKKRRRQEHVRRLRVDRQPQTGPPTTTDRPRGPHHEPQRDQGKVEDLRGQPPHVQRSHPAHEEPQHQEQRRPTPPIPRRRSSP